MAPRPAGGGPKLQDDLLVRAEIRWYLQSGGAETLEQLNGFELNRYLAGGRPRRSPTPDPSSNTTTPAAECYITGQTIAVAGGQVLLESTEALRV